MTSSNTTRRIPPSRKYRRTYQTRNRTRVVAAIESDAPEIIVPPPAVDSDAAAIRTADAIIIGAGVGGLSCAALLAKYGVNVAVLESHYQIGGAAHGWSAKGKSGVYHFESGPSLYSGMQSRTIDGNPFGHVLQAIGEDLEWIKYNSWQIYFPEGEWCAKAGTTHATRAEFYTGGRSSDAVKQWKRLEDVMKDYASAAAAVPPIAIRNDPGALLTVAARYLPSLLLNGTKFPKLLRPFSEFIDGIVTDQFILDYIDLLSFLLCGLPADGIISAEMAVMFNEWYKPDCCLEFPKGGSQAIVDTLARYVERNGGKVMTRTHVETILIENNRAVGVRLRGGREIRARKAVISNATIWDTIKLIPTEHLPPDLKRRDRDIPQTPSFMHLHVGFDATDLDVDLHHIVVNKWRPSVTCEQNVVLVSIPSVVDPSFAPPGKHALHAYLPATEPYHVWEGIDRKSEAYEKLKAERSEVLWKGVERFIPDVRDRVEMAFVGTPLTHERFLRRYRGTYGPGIKSGEGMFPSQMTSVKGLVCCGDSTFPGIGLPAVAASGAIAANSLVPVSDHWRLLTELEF